MVPCASLVWGLFGLQAWRMLPAHHANNVAHHQFRCCALYGAYMYLHDLRYGFDTVVQDLSSDYGVFDACDVFWYGLLYVRHTSMIRVGCMHVVHRTCME